MAHIKIYSGSQVLVKAVAARLEEAGIPFIEKDTTRGGAVMGQLNSVYEIHVEETDKARAEELLAGFVN